MDTLLFITNSIILFTHLSVLYRMYPVSYNSCRITGNYTIIRNIFCHNSTTTDNNFITDPNPTHNNCIGTYKTLSSNKRILMNTPAIIMRENYCSRCNITLISNMNATRIHTIQTTPHRNS